MGFGTRCVHAGEGGHPHGAHAIPIYQTSTFIFESARERPRRPSREESRATGTPGAIPIPLPTWHSWRRWSP